MAPFEDHRWFEPGPAAGTERCRPRLRLAVSVLALMPGCLCLPADQTLPVPDPGPFATVRSDVEVARPDNSTFSAVVYAPVSPGDNTDAVEQLTWPVPAIVFAHGFLGTPDLHVSTLEHLASHGYILIATRSGGELFPNHEAYADDLTYCLTYLEQQASDAASPWYQRIDPSRLGLLGYSMGGGAGILAAASDGRVRALATLAPAETMPSAIAAAARVTAQKCFIYGTDDLYVPPAGNSLPMYDAAAPPRLAIAIQGGSHCGFMDAGSFGCDSGSLSRTDELTITWARLEAFFDLYLKDLPDARTPLLEESGPVRVIADLGATP